MGISAWFLLKKREEWLASRSILIASVFGLLSSLMVAFTGDISARTISKVQPVKFAAMEAHYEGSTNAGLVAFGILKKSDKMLVKEKPVNDFLISIKIPGLLSIMTGGDKEVFVPGISDLIHYGDSARNSLAIPVMMERGKFAKELLTSYKRAKMIGERDQVVAIKDEFFSKKEFYDEYFQYFGYGFLNSPEEAIPDVKISFYSFHLMVMIGFLFIVVSVIALYYGLKNKLAANRWFLRIILLCIPLAYIASESGWVLAEIGRQPWIIQNLMPVSTGVTKIGTGSVITTFILFAILFTALLAAEIAIMVRQIKSGPKH
jgi:cytochrome d ubiquinol oxidase subunit I